MHGDPCGGRITVPMVYHLKPDELVKIGDRRVALSVGRDPTSIPPLSPPITLKMTHQRENGVHPEPLPAPRRAPVFLIIELEAGESINLGGMRLMWDNCSQKHHGKKPSLLIDAPKSTHPVSKCEERAQLARNEIVGVLP